MNLGTLDRQRARQLLAATLLTLAFDQLSKYLLLFKVNMIGGAPVVLNEYMSLVMVWNRGVSFGILSKSGADWGPYLLMALALVICFILSRLALKSGRRWERIAYGMIVGGALGNVIDRIRFGAVAEFFYVHVGDLGWPAFNVADSAICIGVAILLLLMTRNSRMAA